MQVHAEQAFETKKESRWINKQRTLVVSSRGIIERHKQLMLDLVNMLPHAKKEVKLEKKDVQSQINELCFIHTCCNFMYFESRKRQDLYLWIGRFPNGPTVKFQVDDIHTTEDTRFQGNCVKGSRHILSFDNSFQEEIHLKLIRELFVHSFNVPKYHPKSKPTVDHLFNFTSCDKKIWFRNYQITTEDLGKDLENRQLYEVGPRFVLNPICIFEGAMIGSILFKNTEFVTRTQLSVQKKKERRDLMMAREKKQTKNEETKNMELEYDEVDDILQNNQGEEEEELDDGSDYESLDDEDVDEHEDDMEEEEEEEEQ